MTLGSVTDQVSSVIRAQGASLAGGSRFGIALPAPLSCSDLGVGYLFWDGIGVWGNNSPVGWGLDITNFVWWIGIGHAGTLICAILFLFRQHWRTSINRFAEAMTIFAVICGRLFPPLHVGRPWLTLLARSRSRTDGHVAELQEPALVGRVRRQHLLHGLAAVLVRRPLARPGDAARPRQVVGGAARLRRVRARLARLARHWRNYERAYLLLAAISTPLVLSVHSVVSFDFAISVIPGWHTTIFPPYFVAGAIFSGFAMVLTLMIIARQVYGLKELMTMRHLENMNKIMLVTGSLVGYAYAMEFFIAWYCGQRVRALRVHQPATGPYWWAYLDDGHLQRDLAAALLVPEALRTSIPVMFVLSILINIGMWFERFVIIVTSLHRDYLPSSWGITSPNHRTSVLRGIARLVLHVLLALHSVAAADRDVRDAHARTASRSRQGEGA